MSCLRRVSLIAATFVLSACAAQATRATEPPADLCSLLPAAEVSKTLGHGYDAPQKSVAPRPFANTAQGTDCRYMRSNDPRDRKLLFRIYFDPSPAAATELFARLGMFYSPKSPVPGLGDEAYFDRDHGLHVRKGKVRFFLAMDDFDEKQMKDLASRVIGRL
ncbi:MAG: hypothetical protein ACHQIK_07265 [Candidatus Acidiferrales bacterium]